jgi:hypothetical protein
VRGVHVVGGRPANPFLPDARREVTTTTSEQGRAAAPAMSFWRRRRPFRKQATKEMTVNTYELEFARADYERDLLWAARPFARSISSQLVRRGIRFLLAPAGSALGRLRWRVSASPREATQ